MTGNARVICGSFVNLEELELLNLYELTDADGVKLCRLKKLRKLCLFEVDGLSDLTFDEDLGSTMLAEL